MPFEVVSLHVIAPLDLRLYALFDQHLDLLWVWLVHRGHPP